jgi:hypothetical protein
MKKYIPSLLFTFAVGAAHAQFFNGLSVPKVWLRADSSASLPGQWQDVSGNKLHATATLTAIPANTGIINYNKAMVFDGVDDKMTIPLSLEHTSGITILSVFHVSDTAEHGILRAEKAIARKVRLTTRRADGPNNTVTYYGKNEQRTVIQTTAQNWGKKTAPNLAAYLTLGRASSSHAPLKGSLAELLVFDRTLGFLERVQVETYLAIKYGAAIPGRNYVSSSKQLLWDAERNQTYQNNIAGLGRDDAFGLHQKQAGSAYDSGFLVMSAGALARSNAENRTTLRNNDFILWGDNGKTLTVVPGNGADSVLAMVQRKWMVTATGATASKTPTHLLIDDKRIPSHALGYWLVIDRSGTGNFSVDNLEYVFPDRASDGKIVYKNVYWDTDGSGQDHFGFARARDLFAVVRTLQGPTCTDTLAGRIKVEVIIGEAPFSYKLKVPNESNAREWSGPERSTEQKNLPTGAYILTLKEASGDQLVRHFTLPVANALPINLGPDQKLKPGEEILLNAAKGVPDSVRVKYQWTSNFGHSSTEKKLRITESGIYKVTITRESDGCPFSDEVIISGTETEKLAVYPVPVAPNSVFSVSVSLEAPGDVSMRLYDATGVLKQQLNGTGQAEYHFLMSAKTAGMYLVAIQTPKGMQTRKVLVE